MSDKPSYLGLLNAVALAESRAHQYLSAWMEVTPSAEVRSVLATVAAREGEHGMAFAKRINELGYAVRPKDDGRFAEQMEIARSDRSDLEKMELLELGRLDTEGQPDVFDRFFADHSIDIRTGELLGRYIAEERDSNRLLCQCRTQLAAVSASGDGSVATTERLAQLDSKVDALCQAVEDLRQMVSAQAKGGARR